MMYHAYVDTMGVLIFIVSEIEPSSADHSRTERER